MNAAVCTIESQTKASLLRARQETLRRLGRLAELRVALPAESRRWLTDPPLASTWIDSRILFELDHAIYRRFGPDVTRQVGEESLRGDVVGVLRFTAEATLRLFGVSPATLLTHFDRLARTTIRGTVFQYTAESPRAGVLLQRYLRGEGCPYGAWLASTGGMRLVFEMTGCRSGTISDPEVLPGQSAARYRFTW
jgi:hypothetical protein